MCFFYLISESNLKKSINSPFLDLAMAEGTWSNPRPHPSSFLYMRIYSVILYYMFAV